MVSYGPNTESCNFTHMYSFVDYRNNQEPELCPNPGTLYDYIRKNPNMSKFKRIVEYAMMSGQLNEHEADFTLFIPTDNFLKHIPKEYFEYMDNGLARQIFNSSTLWRQLNKDMITSSPVAYYNTRNPEMRMYVTNISGQTRINNCATIVKYDIITNNGIIHIVDNLIAPNMDTFMN